MNDYITEEMNSGEHEICKCGKAMSWVYGDWYCSHCSEKEAYEDMQSDYEYWDKMRLCQSCNYYCNEDCSKYPRQNPRFFGRKHKCKYYAKTERGLK